MFSQPACCFGSVVLGDGEQNRGTGFNRIDCLLQLTELLFAEGSPGAAAKKLQNDCLFAPVVGKAKGVSLRVFELEIRCFTPDLRPLRRDLSGQRKADNQQKCANELHYHPPLLDHLNFMALEAAKFTSL